MAYILSAACVSLAGFVLYFPGARPCLAQGMMYGDGTRGMMQHMMGDILPPMNPQQLPEPNSKGAVLLQQFCTQCHALPDPEKHTAHEWPAVVDRMKGYMESMGKTVPKEKELQELVDFLQKHGMTTSSK